MTGLRRRALLGVPALAALPLTALPRAARAQDRESVRIGMTVSSTGPFATASQSGERGIGIWLDDINSRGGITLSGRKYKVDLVKRDDRSDKQMVSRVYDALINEDKVDALIAPFSSTLVSVVAPVADSGNKFMTSWAGSSDDLFKQGYKTIVSVTTQASQIPMTTIGVAKSLGVDKLAVVFDDEPFPASTAAAAQTLAKQAGVEVVMAEKYAKGTKDFGILLTKAKAAGANGFYTPSYDGDAIIMIRQMKENAITFPFTYMLYGSMASVTGLGKDADYIFSYTQFEKSVNWPVTDGLGTVAFLAAYDRLYPNAAYPADFQTALAYGAGVILQKAIETADSVDAAKLKAATLAFSGKTTILAGHFAIDATGFQTGIQPLVLQQQAGAMKVIAPTDIANAKPLYPAPDWSKR